MKRTGWAHAPSMVVSPQLPCGPQERLARRHPFGRAGRTFGGIAVGGAPSRPGLDRADLAHLRALLFVPVMRERFVASALRASPPAVILDFEDSIPVHEKAAARAAVRPATASFRTAGIPVFIRVNRGDANDIEACRAASPDGVFLPKVEGPDEAKKAAGLLRQDGARPLLVATIETAKGVLTAPAIAAAEAVDGLMFGAGDFVADAGFALDAEALRLPATLVSLAARAHGKPALGLADGAMGLIGDADALGASAARARDIGYSGTPVIHPGQVAPVVSAFLPSPDEVARARRIVAVFEASDGPAGRLRAELIERPVYLRALAVLRTQPDMLPPPGTSGDPQ